MNEKLYFNQQIDVINKEFYNKSGNSFDKIPFDNILPDLLLKYINGPEILEIGSWAGALAAWLMKHNYRVTCIEPAEQLATKAAAKGLHVYPTTIQNFQTNHKYHSIIAISSLIHVPKNDLPAQIQKIINLLHPHGIFFISLIEGKGEEFADPTNVGKLRYFSKWTESELNSLLSPYFTLLENHKIYNKKMDRIFILQVYRLK